MTGPTLDELIAREPIDPPPRAFEVVDAIMDGYRYICVRRRDGKPYRPFEPMGVNPEQYRAECEWLCDLMNDAHDYGAMEQIKRARATDRAATDAFAGGPDLLDTLIDIARTTQAAE